MVSRLMPPSTSSRARLPVARSNTPGPGELVQRVRNELLAAEARIDRHDKGEVDETGDLAQGFDGRAGVDRDAGGAAQLLDAAQMAVQVRQWPLRESSCPVAPALAKRVEVAFGLDHHHVDVERERRQGHGPSRSSWRRTSGSGRTGHPSHRGGAVGAPASHAATAAASRAQSALSKEGAIHTLTGCAPAETVRSMAVPAATATPSDRTLGGHGACRLVGRRIQLARRSSQPELLELRPRLAEGATDEIRHLDRRRARADDEGRSPTAE